MQPSRIGPYLIERKIGAGGMGTVYFGRHAETGHGVAVKTLSALLADHDGFIARFFREVEALKKLANPHVVELYESGLDGETYYYAMEYVEGETLTSRLLREKRLAWPEVIETAVEICAALKAAHDAGVIHRDLKPSNLLIASDGSVKLTDFGVAQVFAGTKLTATGGVIGTAEYMSPEQAQGRRATKQSDLYSLGAVMYAMLTGRPPFTGKTTIEVIHKQRYGRFDRPCRFVPEIPHWLDEIVCQLLEKEPEKRIPDAYVLSRRLQEVISKVELSSREQTLAAEGAVNSGGATTVAAGSEGGGPGAGTLMRDLVRAEIEASQQPATLGSLLNNTWVLVGLLALLIAGGVFWFQSRQLTPEQRFDAGIAIMEQPEGPAWLRARDDYFRPLLESDPDTWQERIEPYLTRIELYDLKRQMRLRRLGKHDLPESEALRFLRLAQHYREAGDVAQAERMLSALDALLADHSEHETEHRLAKQLLTELRSEHAAGTGRDALLESALERAERLAQEKQLDRARRIWAAVVELYGGDPAARAFVERARKRLDAMSAPSAP